MTTVRTKVNVEVWSDVVCPWCYIGKRRFERAVGEVADEIDVEITYRAYQLDPRAPVGRPTPVSEAYARKFGGPDQARAIIDRVTAVAAGDDLGFRMDRAVRSNTFDAHRLLWWAERPDTSVEQSALKERLLAAYFVDGLDVGDHATLARCAAEVGADADEVSAFLAGNDGADEVRRSLEQAIELGITGVPAYVVDGMWTIPGAQDTDVFVQVLRRVAARRAAEAADAAGVTDGGTCVDDACDV